MNSREALEVSIAILTTITLGLTIIGLGVRYVLLPWLQTHLIDPILEQVRQIRTETKAAARMFEGHIASSERDHGRLWRAINDRKKQQP